MTSEQATLAVIEVLNQLGVSYMLVGSLSSNYYGIARSTQDADFVVHLEGVSVAEVARLLGPNFRLDPQMSFETVTGTIRSNIYLIQPFFRIELFQLSDDSHDQERFRRRLQVDLFGIKVFVPTAEDVIVMKLRWAFSAMRNKDLDDIKNVLSVQQNKLDFDYIYRWCDQHGTRELFDQIRQTVPTV